MIKIIIKFQDCSLMGTVKTADFQTIHDDIRFFTAKR